MTVSFHQSGSFFPGTGGRDDVGHGKEKNYSVNAPLQEGIDNNSYRSILKPIITKVMGAYNPGAVVLQCGTDSLTGDRLGSFNLSVEGHAECVKFMRSFNVPLMLFGGGGYTIKNVACCWCYETGVALGVELEDKLPENEYYDYFRPDHTLRLPLHSMKNKNRRDSLEKLRNIVLCNLSQLQHAPRVQFQERPAAAKIPEDAEDESMSDSDE